MVKINRNVIKKLAFICRLDEKPAEVGGKLFSHLSACSTGFFNSEA
jgi:hypothetical protein